MSEHITERTKPKPRFPKDFKPNPSILSAGRYGTDDMAKIWGAEQTFESSLESQGVGSLVLSELHPDYLPPNVAQEIFNKANLNHIDPNRIRALEEEKRHDVIAITTALEEVVSEEAKPHIGEIKTSSDTTQNARAKQLKVSFEVLADSVENLRDIIIEKALDWIDIPHMDTTHLYDALPTVAGRPLIHYAEMLQSGLKVLKFFYTNSIMGKWSDATGNHHQAKEVKIDGLSLQEEFCKRLGVNHMDAPSQLPGLEFEADIAYAVTRIGMTVNNLAKYIASGFGDDTNIFIDIDPKERKGSAGMPHKDAKGGNRITEEQEVSMANKLMGWMTTALANCEMPYARSLYASANARIDLEDNFKFVDHCIRNLSRVVYYLDVNKDRSLERVMRTRGIVTSSRVIAHLTDRRMTDKPMPRQEAHNLLGSLAKQSYENKIPFFDVLSKNSEITNRINIQTLADITNPVNYIGESKRIIILVAEKYHKVKTLN